ncbi:MAG TPA: hypothetical protein VGO03_13535 [Acidimicrobiia bacterium]
MDDERDSQRTRHSSAPAPEDAEPMMRSEPIDTDDGGTVVIAQQNVGPGNEVGEGEFPTIHAPVSAEQAAADQARLDEEYERSRPHTLRKHD